MKTTLESDGDGDAAKLSAATGFFPPFLMPCDTEPFSNSG